jgi:hypothetical protein
MVNAATAETLVLQMNVQPNVRNAHCMLRPKYIPLNPDISLLYTVGNMSIPDIPDIAKPRAPLQPDELVAWTGSMFHRTGVSRMDVPSTRS